MRIGTGTMIVAAALLLSAGAVAAQEAKPAIAPAEQPALVPNTTIQPGDSPLVRAAKIAAAKRIKSKTAVIDNKAVKAAKGEHITETRQLGGLPEPLPDIQRPSAPVAEGQRIGRQMTSEDVAKRVAELTAQKNRLLEEAESSFASESTEEVLQKKINDVNDELARLQKTQTPPPQKP